MTPANTTELIKVYGEYVALLEKEIAANVAFLNQNNKPVSAADAAKAKELTDKITALKNAQLSLITFGFNYEEQTLGSAFYWYIMHICMHLYTIFAYKRNILFYCTYKFS